MTSARENEKKDSIKSIARTAHLGAFHNRNLCALVEILLIDRCTKVKYINFSLLG